VQKHLPVYVTALLFVFAPILRAQQKEALRLVQTSPMPNVKGCIDHMDVDVKGKRLFVGGLENGSVEVIDLAAGKWSKSIPGFKKSQGIAYVPVFNKVFVASGDKGMLRLFRGDTLELLDSIKWAIGSRLGIFWVSICTALLKAHHEFWFNTYTTCIGGISTKVRPRRRKC
jgi:hypothetical protein